MKGEERQTPFLKENELTESNLFGELNINDKCNREICSFAPIFQGKNCFRVKCLGKKTFTFDIYLGTSRKEAPAAKEPIQILTGWWKDVLQIFGTN